jgi:hypothetical protein
MDRDFEMDQIKKAVEEIMNHFGKYTLDCDLNWPRCWRCKQQMCQVVKKDCNMFFQCFEVGCNGRMEWGI